MNKETHKPSPPKCHVHDKCDNYDRQSINKDVCRDLETTEHTDGKHYCLLHFPSNEKNSDNFKMIVTERFNNSRMRDDVLLEKHPESFWSDQNHFHYYDFRYVWFPSYAVFKDKTFAGDADFRSATFSGDASFRSVTFSGSANFRSATFSADAYFFSAIFTSDVDFKSATFSGLVYFISATFSGSANFRSATFNGNADFISATFSGLADFRSATLNGNADFSSATFSGYADFLSATFSGYADFSSATFSGYTDFIFASFSRDADFRRATFEEKSQIFFNKTMFEGEVSFNYTNINGFVAFEGNHSNRVFIGDEALLNLQNARIADSKKISFHTVRLEPSWFVNQNYTAEFVFTDCQWRYADGKRKIKVKTEIKHLRKRRISDNPHEILTKACWQLADNHEESKSLSKASMFRKFANESKRLATPWYFQPFTLHWWYYAVSFYGESWRRALVVLVCILSVFAFLFTTRLASFDYGKERPVKTFHGYTDVFADNLEIIKTTICGNVDDTEQFRPMNRCEAVSHSLAVASFQRPEPKSDGFFTKLLTTLETIFAPLQAALLALAIRRKFMR